MASSAVVDYRDEEHQHSNISTDALRCVKTVSECSINLRIED